MEAQTSSLRTSRCSATRRGWQDLFVSEMESTGIRRLKSDVHQTFFVIVLACAGDVMALGQEGDVENVFKRLKRRLRYIKGALRDKMALRPTTPLPPVAGQEVNLRVHVGANWAGCASIRKNTSGALILRVACPIQFVSKTQNVIARLQQRGSCMRSEQGQEKHFVYVHLSSGQSW